MQGVNDTSVFAFNFSGALLAGVALGYWGWSSITQISFGIIVVLSLIALLKNLYLQPEKELSEQTA